MTNKTLYKIIFSHLDSVYEMYARKISESELFGFIEVEEFVFGETTSLVVDPSEERLKLEFSGVKRAYIPLQSIFRIDVVNRQGAAKVRDKSIDSGKVSLFPVPNKPKD